MSFRKRRHIETHNNTSEQGDEDLLNLTAMHTIINGGGVYAPPHEHRLDDAALAVIFRYCNYAR